jgi:hypothetical protein
MPLAVRVAQPGETEYRLNHVGEALSGRHLDAQAGVMPVARVPPVVPHAGLDDGGFTPTEDTSLPCELHSQLTLKHGEGLNESGVAVLAHDACSNERRQFSSRAPFLVVVWKLDNPGPLAGHRIFPDLANLDRSAVRWAMRIGVRHTHFSKYGRCAVKGVI